MYVDEFAQTLNKDLIRSVAALLLTVVAVAIIFAIVISTVTDDNPANDQHLILIFMLVGVTVARMYMCLPSGTRVSRPMSRTVESLLCEQMSNYREEGQLQTVIVGRREEDESAGITLAQFMGSYYRYGQEESEKSSLVSLPPSYSVVMGETRPSLSIVSQGLEDTAPRDGGLEHGDQGRGNQEQEEGDLHTRSDGLPTYLQAIASEGEGGLLNIGYTP